MSIDSLRTVLRPVGLPSAMRALAEGATRGLDRAALRVRDLHPSAVALVLVDAMLWIVGLWAASGLRLETPALSRGLTLGEGATPVLGLLICAGIGVLAYTVLARFLRLHQGRHLVGSFDEIRPLASVIAFVSVLIAVVNIAGPERMLPATTPLIAAPLILVMALAVRYGMRALALRDLRTSGGGTAPERNRRVLIVGAGRVGRDLADSMRRDPSSIWEPVAFLDDDSRKRFLRHSGLSVVGRTAQFAHAAEKLRADVLVIATTVIGAETMSSLTAEAKRLGIAVKIVPPLREMIDGIRHTDLRDVQTEDLLGRNPITTDLGTIATLIEGRTVLVTGAGGSIGSELCRQIAEFSPAELVMLDRDESALHALMLTMGGTADLGDDNMELADIRDAERLDAVFARHRPHVVFHAAALKHVNMLEKSPDEAFKTNVLGTHNVLEAADHHGAEHVVNISTDKAADPHNVLGYSKRIAEGLTAHKGLTAGHGTWLSVRFGNVLATRGSVIHTFIAQIKKGGPVTVTDPEVTRYFMTVSEAVQLVLQAAVLGESGKALVLDMGEPVPIVKLAQQLIEASGKDIAIEYSGLRPGEKLHEDLFAPGEDSAVTSHPLIRGVPVVPVSRVELPAPADLHGDAEYRGAMTAVCGSMSSSIPSLPTASGF
ncbi:nucleoside-diphosphate sugar epimerase/dehydratase [Brachybacterium aquaticum]|uniref:FlaA1/EpsC-like NDP-sugar epimerase n=1 Tax=Brachybacterium aquaticum TaxID=1432564 RepID=A0A841AFG3_9MICO|nr:nucleoside-diphosphate sugar epimerase/dehydratase [Brachybacterium aquaticum]MBB5832723.1 FlaA1/EpsC-like NDP-sugar epimerase [Brachybacterium aquaticum]